MPKRQDHPTNMKGMLKLMRLGWWLADGGGHLLRNSPYQRRRGLFALLMFHFLVIRLAWVAYLIFRELLALEANGSSLFAHLLASLLRLPLFDLVALNIVSSVTMLAMLRKRVSLIKIVGLWASYLYAHSFYYSLRYPSLCTDKWYLFPNFKNIFWIYIFPRNFYIFKNSSN